MHLLRFQTVDANRNMQYASLYKMDFKVLDKVGEEGTTIFTIHSPAFLDRWREDQYFQYKSYY